MGAYKASKRPTGIVNRTAVSCSGCGATSYVVSTGVRSAGGKWKCPDCKKVN